MGEASKMDEKRRIAEMSRENVTESSVPVTGEGEGRG